MTWRNAVASVVLAQEVNGLWPGRDKASDGTLGDAAHASRKSDHNPWIKDPNGVGVVRARDIDEDLDGKVANTGPDALPLFNHLLSLGKKGDRRLNGGGYLIYERKIYSERNNWAARNYTGANPHDHHIHVSLSLDRAGYDSDAPWGIGKTEVVEQVLHLGSKGESVAFAADMGNVMAKAGFAVNSKGKSTKVQLRVPKDKAGRSQFVYTARVRERVAEVQRFAHAMWVLGGKNGREPLVDGIAGKQYASIVAFWVPIALQNTKR